MNTAATVRARVHPRLKAILRVLVAGGRLDSLHRDRKLLGRFVGRRECHIESDWLLVCKTEGDTVIFERTGTRSDLFGRGAGWGGRRAT